MVWEDFADVEGGGAVEEEGVEEDEGVGHGDAACEGRLVGDAEVLGLDDGAADEATEAAEEAAQLQVRAQDGARRW